MIKTNIAQAVDLLWESNILQVRQQNLQFLKNENEEEIKVFMYGDD